MVRIPIAAALLVTVSVVCLGAGPGRLAGPTELLLVQPPVPPSRQTDLEQRLIHAASAKSLREFHILLASEPHVAGTPGDLRQVKRLADAFRAMGLTVQEHEFWAYLCMPVAAELEVVAPEHVPLAIKEDTLPEDPYTANPDLTPGWNAYSGDGDVCAEVVYANYGTKEDFAKLAELGVVASGKIVFARYGGNFRGYKAKFAQAAGAAGLIIYTDPADSGYAKGIPYPEGGFANETYIQRGSILTVPYAGDPLTPFVEATKDAKRLDPAKAELPTIPVQPVGWGAAKQIVGRMKGAGVPQGWQGGLPFAYRLTGGEALRVHLKVQQKRAVTRTLNVVATLRGAVHPEQKVVLGSHHDAWGFGAADPLCGTITVLESARILSDAAKQGHPPARSIVFAAWGAEEFGIIGSTEWVEANRDDLAAHAVAYINLDMASMGTQFGASASPALAGVITDAAQIVPQARAKDSQTVLQEWSARSPDPAMSGLPKLGDLGGGSDHVAFLCHVGVPSAGFGAGGSQGTSYHSTYDDLNWYWTVVGDDYEPAVMITRMTSIVAARLAWDPVLPLDVARVGGDVQRHLKDLTRRGRDLGLFEKPPAPSTPPNPPTAAPPAAAPDAIDLDPALRPLAETAAAYEVFARGVEERLRQTTAQSGLSADKIVAINTLILSLDRAWVSDVGVPGRPWFRNLYVASDEDSGYASWMLPVLRHAIERKDGAEVARAVATYQRIFARLTEITRQMGVILDEPATGP